MAGVLPKTRYLLVTNGVVQGDFCSILQIAHHYGTSINSDGRITFNGNECGPSYAMYDKDDCHLSWNGWRPSDAVADFARCHMETHLPSGTVVYRYLVA